MKILLFLISITTFIFCHNQTVKQQQTDNSAMPIATKTDSLPDMNLLDSDYTVRERLTDSVLKTMLPNVPTMNVKMLNKAFYKYLKGTFNGKAAIMNLNFGHFDYEGKLVFSGTLYLDSEQKMYEIWGEKSDTIPFISFYVSDKAEANFDNLFILQGHIDEKKVLEGLILDTRTLKQGNFEFRESNTEGCAFFDFTECFARKKYTGKQSENDKERAYFAAYANDVPLVKVSNAPEIYGFLKQYFSPSGKCPPIADSFVNQGVKVIEKALKREGSSLRNSVNSMIFANSIYWNQDNLVVINNFVWDNTDLMSYGGAGVEFSTYDLKRKRKLTEKDVFKDDYDDEPFAKAIYAHFEWEEETNDKGKVEIRMNNTNGYTSKGFYMVGKGNHGWYVSPVFIPYAVVEPFLRDDFKKEYWKK
jgi:hypothetical protein